MEAGICYIKSEFLISDLKKQTIEQDLEHSEGKKRKDPPGENHESDVKTGGNDKSPYKHQKPGKNNRQRGQNKNRPIYKDDRTLHLCHSLIHGPSSIPCPVANCRYMHDLEAYLKLKGEDLGTECVVFTTKGFCPRGVTCRFAKSHLDADGRNIKAAYYDATAKPTTCNGIVSELQVQLRKREYDFKRTKDLVSHFDALRAARKNRTEQNGQSIGTDLNQPSPPLEKPVGCVIDSDVERTTPIDFFNKLVLAPLTTVGNLPFRRICKEFGADITCGEMACAVPLVKGLTQEWALTKRHVSENIFGVQLCGNNPTIITQAAQLLQETASVDFIDLNIGCPIDLIYQQGGGSALMRRTNILETTVRSCAAMSPQIPFTVKMRTGVYADKSVAHELMPLVEEWGAAAVTLHGRSREQRYTKTANWEYMEKCAGMVKRMPVIGNGDILSFEDFNEKKKIAPHVSSVMIGRGALIKPWIFKEIKEQKHWDITSQERFEIMRKFVNYGLEHWGSDTKGVENTRRFFLEWQSFLYRYIPFELLECPPQRHNQRPQKYRGRDEMETLLSSSNATDWVKLSEMLLGPVPNGFTFVPKHKANAY